MHDPHSCVTHGTSTPVDGSRSGLCRWRTDPAESPCQEPEGQCQMSRSSEMMQFHRVVNL